MHCKLCTQGISTTSESDVVTGGITHEIGQNMHRLLKRECSHACVNKLTRWLTLLGILDHVSVTVTSTFAAHSWHGRRKSQLNLKNINFRFCVFSSGLCLLEVLGRQWLHLQCKLVLVQGEDEDARPQVRKKFSGPITVYNSDPHAMQVCLT